MHDSEHPKDRPLEPEDPMMLKAEPVAGDPAVMLECIVEEYARIGWGLEEIVDLFDAPFFQATNGLQTLFGKDEIRRRVERILNRCGVFQCRTTVTDADEE